MERQRDWLRRYERVAAAAFAVTIAAAVGLLVSASIVGVREFSTVVRGFGYASFIFWLAAAGTFAYALIRSVLHELPLPLVARVRTWKWPVLWIGLVFAGLASVSLAIAIGCEIFRLPSAKAIGPPASLHVRWAVGEPLRVDARAQGFDRSPVEARLEAVDSRGRVCPAGRSYSWTIELVDASHDVAAAKDPVGCPIDTKLPDRESEVRVRTRDAEGTPAVGDSRVKPNDYVIASFGDSVASGEGNPPWSDRSKCHRSDAAGTVLAARMLEHLKAHSVAFLAHVACTGAWIERAGQWLSLLGRHPSILPKGRKKGEIGLYRKMAGMDDANIVFLSVGANDIGFGKIVFHCLVATDCQNKKIHGIVKSVSPERLLSDRLATLRTSYGDLSRIEPFDRSDVFVAEYFDPLRDESGRICREIKAPSFLGKFAKIDRSEAAWAEKDVVNRLNRRIRRIAWKYHWHFVGGIAAGFKRHGICAIHGSWIVPLKSVLHKNDRMAAFHPNREGQRFYARKIVTAVLRVLAAEHGSKRA